MTNNLGEFIRERRLSMGMSLREFAAVCNVSHTHIDSIEKGYDVRSGRPVNLTSTTIEKLAAALSMKESELMAISSGSEAECAVSDSQLKIALFGRADVSDMALLQVKNFAEYIMNVESMIKDGKN